MSAETDIHVADIYMLNVLSRLPVFFFFMFLQYSL